MKHGGLAEKIYGLILAEEKQTLGIRILRMVATVVAWSYDKLTIFRNFLFDLRILKVHKLSCPVISVGNLAVGGTGKTPMVIWLARFLLEEGWRVGVVSRGYKGEKTEKVLVVSDGRNILAGSDISGDEPQLLARRLPGIPVLCSTKRALAAEAAVEQFRCEVVILDDGFQHRFVARNLDIVMFDSRYPFGDGSLFPRGILREQTTALTRAQVLVLSRFDGSEQAEQSHKNLVGQWPDKTVVTAAHRATHLFKATTQKELPLSSVENKRLAAFAGIGRPDDFFRTVRGLGADLVHTTALPDHHPLTIELLASLVEEASDQKPELWLTTEKDWVRLPSDLPDSMELMILAVEIDLDGDSSLLKAVVQESLRTSSPDIS
ncbi:MAG: tetraacyldisaccharide 4'-kinase [Deltaproteobacteria bacterium]|nr:tetraacyldisaccharide 4'-kinase [Deltaproteobacteria bacterium]MDH3803283.1 tetraacyldisaccharide 4'-kinase [Deltaproteobacteria bacterium]